MNSLFDTVPYLAAYHTSFLILATLSLIALVQSFLCAPLAFLREEQTPGLPLRHDHSMLSFRAMRTYSNTVENLPAFACALLAAVVGGAPPGLVNLVAAAYLGFRLLFWAVYYSGVGKVAGGLRTQAYVGGLMANIVLACAAIYALV